MTSNDYTYKFGDLQNRLGTVLFTDHRDGKEYELQLSTDDSQLFPRGYFSVPSHVADMVDLATAVYTADRLSLRRQDEVSSIQLAIPVRNPELFSHASIVNLLQDALYWYTKDNWSFTFTKRTSAGRALELQQRLPQITDIDLASSVEIALWSGGLDSLAGLCNRSLDNPSTQFILFGTGGNSYVHSVQSKIAHAVKDYFPEAKGLALVQAPIHLSEILPIRRNSELRARGFVFLLLGAVCADLQGQDTLHIYENGIGAINLPFRSSEVGLDHARSVHPRSLLKMSRLTSALLDKPFSFRNPFLFWTKAQMCEVFAGDCYSKLIAGTITCDRRHRQQFTECGCCSSCIMRRQALAVHRVLDATGYVVPNGRQPGIDDGIHLRAMLYQIETLRDLLASPTPWTTLAQKYRDLWEIVQETAVLEGLSPESMSEQLIKLYKQYVHEWDQVQEPIKVAVLGKKLAPHTA